MDLLLHHSQSPSAMRGEIMPEQLQATQPPNHRWIGNSTHYSFWLSAIGSIREHETTFSDDRLPNNHLNLPLACSLEEENEMS